MGSKERGFDPVEKKIIRKDEFVEMMVDQCKRLVGNRVYYIFVLFFLNSFLPRYCMYFEEISVFDAYLCLRQGITR